MSRNGANWCLATMLMSMKRIQSQTPWNQELGQLFVWNHLEISMGQLNLCVLTQERRLWEGAMGGSNISIQWRKNQPHQWWQPNQFLKCVINAKENREIAVVDLPEAFLHVENDQDVIMFMKGGLAELISLIAPQTCKKYVMVENGQKILCQGTKSFIWHAEKCTLQKLRADLELIGFKVNPYDLCVANKVINGNQTTELWHVSDLKISHCNGWKITKIISD